jgi:hypothetical protein
MKSILDGVTYDTDKANVIAVGTQRNEDDDGTITTTIKTTLYRTITGAFFAVDTVTYNKDDDDEVSYEWQVVGDVAEFCEENRLTIYHDFEGMPPEATPPEGPRIVKAS